MGVSVRARRAWAASFVIAIVAASCALPGYEVGESSSGTSVASTGGGDMTSSATGGGTGGSGQGGQAGEGGSGQGGQAGEGGSGGVAGAGGSGFPMCPEVPPAPDSACAWPQYMCLYPSGMMGESCCDNEFKCVGNDPATATWQFIQKICPPPDCPQDCAPGCPDNPTPLPGCPCRAEMPIVCNYSMCATADKVVYQTGCMPSANPGGKSIWTNMGNHLCCDPATQQPCPNACTTHKDTNGNEVSFCP